jgi:predicted nucleic acid-binding protein
MPVYPNKLIIPDTACLIGLTNIGQLDLLRRLYPSVIITPEIAGEYRNPLPEWIIVQTVSDFKKTILFNTFIDLGESSAIALAMEVRSALLIIDDRRARQFALSLGLEITGTLGLLIRAYENNVLPDIDSIISSLRKINFRIPANTEELIKAIKK